MSQVFWISLLIKVDNIKQMFGDYTNISNCLSQIPVDDIVYKNGDSEIHGPFAVFPNSNKKCEPLTRGSYTNAREYLKRRGIDIPERPEKLTGWRRNKWGDYSVSVVYGLC